MRIKHVLVAILILVAAVSAEDFSKVATGTAQFLKLGVGARGTALGDAYAAVTDDISALYWNPAGIRKMDKLTIGVSRTYLFADINYDFLGAVYPVTPNTRVGLSVLHVSSGDMEVTTISQPEGTGSTFNTAHSAIGVSVAHRLTNRFDLGITIKYINERLFHEKASTIAFDLGSQFDTGIYGLKIGMILANFGGKMKFDGPDLNNKVENEQTGISYRSGSRLKTEEWPIPLYFRLGLMVDLIGGDSEFYPNENNRLTLSIDGNDPVDHVTHYNMGMEYAWNNTIALRVGYKENYDEADYTAGFGLNLTKIGVDALIDYSFNNYGLLGYVHNYSLSFTF